MVEEVTPTREDGVDLDDLADAIAENAFAGPAEGREEQVLTEGLQVPLLPAPHTTRQRHASLSSRIFGSFVPTSIPPPLPSAPTLPTPSTSPSPRRHQRSDSIKSVSSLASASSTSASGYGEWLGWRNWRKEKEGESGVEGSVRSGLAESVVESEGEEEEEETRTFDAITPMATPSGSLFCRPATDPALDDLSSSAPSLASLSTDPSSPNSSQPSTTASRRKSSNAPPLPLLSPHLVLEPSLSTPIPTSTLSTPLLDRHPILPNALLDRHPILPNGNALPNGVADKIVQPSHFTAVVSAAAWWAGGKAERNVLVKPDGVSTRIRELVESLLGNVAEGASISTRDGDAVDTVKPRKLPLLAIPDATSSLSSSSSTTSSKRASKSYVSVAKGSITRALGLSAPRLDGSVRRTPSLSLPPNPTPNLTLFPKLSSLSRYSPFAQPALATPSTQVSLSTGSTPIVPHAPPPPPLSAPTTMELDTISGEAAPPTLALHNPSTGRAAGDKDEGPMVDRYGFVYDIRSGMKLLREARRRQERAGRGEGSEAGDAEAVGDAAGEEAGAVERGQAEEEAELEELRGALGLPKSTAGSPTVPRSPATRRTDLPSSTTLSPAPLRPPRLVRSTSDSPPVPSGQQSMKRLLGLLTEMHDAVEKTRQEGWDAFIRRRQVALTKGAGDAPMRRERSRASGGEAGEDAWSENLVGVAQMGTAGKVGKEDWAEFKQLVRRGIPIAYRPKIWAECSGANDQREPGMYQELLAAHRGEENQCLNQIDMDCHRTFPTNVFFAGNGPGVAKLRNVLIAYSWRNPKIGYCQGMNNLTATLLLTHPAEEDAFWVLVCIIEKILPEDYYTSHLLVSQADQRVLRDLIQRHLPTIANHLEDLGVELPAVTFGWFLSLFTDALPIQTLLRIWDLLFVFGTVILFRVAVAIIQMNSAEILACDSAASLYALMRTMTTHLYQVDKLLQIAVEDLRPIVKDRDISILRTRHVADLRVEMSIPPEDEDDDP